MENKNGVVKKIFGSKVSVLIIIALIVIIVGLAWWGLGKQSSSEAQKVVDKIDIARKNNDVEGIKSALEDLTCNYLANSYFEIAKSSTASDTIKLKDYKITSCKITRYLTELRSEMYRGVVAEVNYEVIPENFDISIWNPTNEIINLSGKQDGKTVTGEINLSIDYADNYHDINEKLYADLYYVNAFTGATDSYGTSIDQEQAFTDNMDVPTEEVPIEEGNIAE